MDARGVPWGVELAGAYIPGVNVADVDVFVFAVEVEFGLVGVREVAEAWCHGGSEVG